MDGKDVKDMGIDLSRLHYPHPPYPGMRQAVYGLRGMVATSQPLAAQVGLAVLQRGGNAVDAAIATAITLTVVEPGSCGMGGDAFALVWDGRQLHGLNGSGRSPASLTLETIRQSGYQKMPGRGWLPVTVPGAPAAWRDLHGRFGRLPFAALFEAAIHYAEEGYPVAPVCAWQWKRSLGSFQQELESAMFSNMADVFAPGGELPEAGKVWRSAEMARSLGLIAESGAEAFYHGELMEQICSHARETGGFLEPGDFERHESGWVEPIHTNYRGYDVWEIPPNGQGLTALVALNIMEGFEIGRHPRESVESYHLQIEALKLAYADAQRYIADPEKAAVPTEELLSKDYAAKRRALIGEAALMPESGNPLAGDTCYLCTADSDGMMVSFILSTFASFGSGVVVPGTGIALQNRGRGFSLEPDHPNCFEPEKRPYHTIIPGFLTRNGEAVGPFGVMGGHMQPQGHLQVVVKMVDYGLDPQAALDAPRWYWRDGRYIQVEPAVSERIVQGLRRRGHEVFVDMDIDFVGGGQIIRRLPNGAYVGGTEGRKDGSVLGY
jgi:gamma-glutamyltranspeptidase / glutathione hydrolase